MSADTAVLAGGEREPMNTTTRNLGRRLGPLGLALLLALALAGDRGRAAAVPAAIYGAGPRTVFESNAKRADEHLVLADLRRATKVVARTLFDLLQ